MEAQQLRQALLLAVENGEAYTEEAIDKVLDAVIEALPGVNIDYDMHDPKLQGAYEYSKVVLKLLQSAKSKEKS